jgi:biotin carboxyl carrier protein
MSRYSIAVNGRTYLVELLERRGGALSFSIEGTRYTVEVAAATSPTSVAPQQAADGRHAGPQEIRAPIPGIISEVRVTPGDTVTADSTLVVIEAMKMENPIKAARAGTVSKVHVSKGHEVLSGHLLVEIE